MKFFTPLVALCMWRSVFGETFPQCEDLESGSFVGGTSGCKSYIYCDGEDSYEGMCPSQLLFNTKDGSCAPASEVVCDDNAAPTTTTTTTTTAATTTTTTTTTRTTRPTTTTRKTSTARPETTTKAVTTPITSTTEVSISSTEDPATETESPIDSVEVTREESGELHTEDEVQFTETTTRPPPTTPLVDVTNAFTSRPMLSCPEVDRPDEVVFLPSQTSCSEYFVCYHGSPMAMTCSGQLYFDYLISKCELPERVNCLILSASTPNPRKQCTVNSFDLFPYPTNCNYFYKCINGFLSLQQCPIGFGWNDDVKVCIKLADGRCPVGRLGQLQLSHGNRKFF